jgi:GxxExxY protein
LEKVYKNGLKHRLEKAGFKVQTQVPIQICDEDGFVLGDYVADMVVDGLIVELKAVSMLLEVHTAQLINYLKATGIEHGMLINFGSEKFQCRQFYT